MNTYELLMSAYIRMHIFYVFLIVICKLKSNFSQWNFLLVAYFKRSLVQEYSRV